ncbi:MAG: hypothetical protein ACOC56_04495 [Atribacterota bacterium]
MIHNVEKIREKLYEIKKEYKKELERQAQFYNKLFIDVETKPEFLIKCLDNIFINTTQEYNIIFDVDNYYGNVQLSFIRAMLNAIDKNIEINLDDFYSDEAIIYDGYSVITSPFSFIDNSIFYKINDNDRFEAIEYNKFLEKCSEIEMNIFNDSATISFTDNVIEVPDVISLSIYDIKEFIKKYNDIKPNMVETSHRPYHSVWFNGVQFIKLFEGYVSETDYKFYPYKISLGSVRDTYKDYIIVKKYNYGIEELDIFISLDEYNKNVGGSI